MKLPFRGALKVSGDGIPASNNGRKVSQILAYEEGERLCSTVFDYPALFICLTMIDHRTLRYRTTIFYPPSADTCTSIPHRSEMHNGECAFMNWNR